MSNLSSPFAAAACGLAAACALAAITWIVSVFKKDVSIVDSMWSALIMLAAIVYASVLADTGPRTAWVLIAGSIWGLRLAIYITWRNWGEPEDHRYQEIRKRNQPNFAFKSLYLVFVLQAVLAWIVSLPLLAATQSEAALDWLDFAGIALIALGVLFEAFSDWQLARFKAQKKNHGKVMDSGLWRYTRHPNYFGEFCTWWGFFLVALSAGGWWAAASPLLMSLLLLKVSGVTLLEKDIVERRPAYREYIRNTNAFFPGPPRRPS